MKKIIGISLLWGMTIFARDLSIEEAIDLSLLNDKLIKVSEISRENSKLDVRVAFKSALPSIAYTGGFEESDYGRTVDGVDNRRKSYLQGITFSQPLFQGGAILGGITGSKAFQNIADLNYLGVKRDVRFTAIDIYCNILILEKNLELYESSKKELEEEMRNQGEKLRLNLITLADLLKTESSLLDIESQIIDTENSISVAKLNLKIITGISEDEEIEVKPFEFQEDITKNIDFRKDLAQALDSSLSAKIAENSVKLADAQRVVSRSTLLPQVNAFAQYGGLQKRSYRDTVDDAHWLGGVNVTWSVFSFGKSWDSYTISKNNERIEMLNQKITADNIKISVTDSYHALIKYEKLLESDHKNVLATKENLSIDSERYRVGLISTTDYLISFNQYLNAAVTYNTDLIKYYVAFERYRSLLI